MNENNNIIQFYMISFSFSWLVWSIGIILQLEVNPLLVVSLGGIGPIIASLVYFFKMNQNDKVMFMKRLTLINWLYLIISVLTPAVISGLAIVLVAVFNRGSLEMNYELIGGGVLSFLFLLIFGPLPEEIAWRGIAFEELITRLGYKKAQLLVGILWALWHLPLFFIAGSYQYSLRFSMLLCMLFFVDILSLSIVTGSLYLRSSNSILVAIFFHYALNLFGELLSLSKDVELVKSLLIVILAIQLYRSDRVRRINMKLESK